MKSKLLSLFLTATSIATAAPPATLTESDRPTLTFKKTSDPILPRRLVDLGMADGEVRIVINVDSTGKLSEWLVVGYTHPDMAEAVVTALKRWEFEPPKWHGEPVALQRELKFRFESHGMVISIDTANYLDTYLAQRFPERYIFRPTTLKELDRIPTPLNAAPPVVGKRTKAQGTSLVTVEFFIDQTGAVRMPSIVSSEDPELATAAAQAVRDWKFEPPTRRGEPVLVRVQQTFRFQP